VIRESFGVPLTFIEVGSGQVDYASPQQPNAYAKARDQGDLRQASGF
jgi:hypothetical protein